MTEYKQPFITIAKVRAAVWAKTDGCCWYCGKQTNPWIDFCIDHIIPRIDDIKNVVPCCNKCNTRKSHCLEDIEQLRSYLLQREGGNNGEGCFTFYFEKRELMP